MEPSTHRIPVSDGLELNVLEWSTEGVPLILLHGGGNEAHLWDDFIPAIAPHYRVIAVDQRGHGDSDWDPEGRYETKFMVNDLEALTEALQIDRFVLIGFSMGGRVAMSFAGRHPERLAGLVLVDIGPEIDPRGMIRIGQENQAHRAPVFASTDEYTSLLSLNYPAGQPHALIRMAKHGLRQREDGLFELKTDPKMRAARTDDDAARAKEDAFIQEQWDALAKIPCPTLVVRGAASDVLSPDIADKMVDDVLKNGQLAIIPQAAHSVATDNPKAFEAAVSRFVLGE
jgi:pimeloyl-ACP methyl ester carboxylesterase